jgi:hypothetical protein
MRKFVLTILFVFLFSGVALAGSSTYEGYPIINVTVDGKLVQSDVPGIAVNGTTLVPLRAVSESMGANISYDSVTKTAIINTNQSLAPNHDNSTQIDQFKSDIEKIKLYSKISEHYRKLMVLSDIITGISTSLDLAVDDIKLNNSLKSLNKTNDEIINQVIDNYNSILKPTEELMNEANKMGLDISDINKILLSYYDALDYYEASAIFLYDFYYDGKKEDFDKYLANNDDGFTTAMEGSSIALDGYYKFYNKLQDY